MLAAKRLGESIGKRVLFRELDLEIEAGTITVVVGPNGSGKSTLLRRLAGLETASEGELELGGKPLAEIPARERAQRISYLPQDTPLYHDLRVRELVSLGRAPHLGRFSRPGKDDDAIIDDALVRVGMRDLETRGLLTLSGGERQRVMLARMLATRATVLVLDEPTTALDVGHALAFLQLCRALADEGAALVLALHDLDRARRCADQAVCLGGQGGSAEVGPVEDVLTPEILGPRFEVDVGEESGLVFRPRRGGT